MSLPASLVVAAVLGAGLGVLYFSVLWLSTRALGRTRHPMAWLIGGAGVRIALVVGAFVLVMDGRWERLLACLAGFVVARFVLIRALGPQPASGAAGRPS